MLDARATWGWPVLRLMLPQARARLFLVALLAAMVAWGSAIWRAGLPVWGASTLALAVLAGPLALKWRDEWYRYGAVVAVLSIVLAVQSLHMVEHVIQVVQFYTLRWSPFRSSGLLSSLNVEWVHFTWNWLVVASILFVMKGGMRSRWAWLLLIWSVAHSLEHTYLFVRYLRVRETLLGYGYPELAVAQALPGILGRDGLLSQTLVCQLPGLTTTPRVSVHFWWNAGELTLLILAANHYLKTVTTQLRGGAPS